MDRQRTDRRQIPHPGRGTGLFYICSLGGGIGGKARPTTLGAHKKRLGTVRIDIAYDAGAEALAVHVHDVDGLNERKYGKPDLYVKLYLSPDPKKRTKVVGAGATTAFGRPARG